MNLPERSFARETIPISVEDEMRRSYLDYAMSVIVGRALPDVRDGFKPVHRRIFYAMHELSNYWNRPYKKSARVVGDVMGKYHPHGDSAIYDAIVRMAQDFSMRYPLIDGQGNFGSIDGDNAAAQRYTEIRMAKIGHELLADLEKETVDFGPNYDGNEQEPLTLPSRIPNLLINGSAGIAVGMATNIPPHNISDTIDTCKHLLYHPDASVDELIDILKAPDFPTAAIIYGVRGAREAYRTGRGRVIMRARTHIESIGKSDRQAIVIDEIPYQVNKKNLLERIAELVREKQIDGISHIQDESDKDGMRVVIELKKGEYPEVVLNHLYRHTPLQDTFGMNLVALVDGQPRLLNLWQIIDHFLQHRREVITRRTVYDLRKARERGHLLEGLAVALANVDEMITLIKEAINPSTARERLMGRAWNAGLVESLLKQSTEESTALSTSGEAMQTTRMGLDGEHYWLSEIQATEILQMRLQRLTGLEQDKIITEYREVLSQIIDLLDILAKPERVRAIISEDLDQVKAEFGDARRSEIGADVGDIDLADLVTPADMVVTLSHAGYLKSQPLSEYRAQKRGGRGKQATATREDDWIEQLFIAHTHDTLLCFSSAGQVYWLKVYEIPEGTRIGRGKPIVNFFPLQDGEKINAVLAVQEFSADQYVIMATRQGTVKKTSLDAYAHPRKGGIIAINLEENDALAAVALTDGKHDVMLFSDGGKAVRFDENDVRSTGRNSIGVRGMRLREGGQIISMLVAPYQNQTEATGAFSVLTATENGYGKRTALEEYTRHGRGGLGMIAIASSERNGKVVAASLVSEKDELMLITTQGVLVRTRVAGVREIGRATQGVTLIHLDEGDRLSGIYRVLEEEDTDEDINADNNTVPDNSEPPDNKP